MAVTTVQFKELLWQRILRRILKKDDITFLLSSYWLLEKISPRYCLHMPLHRGIDTQSFKPVTNAAEFLSRNQNDDSKTGAWSSLDVLLIFYTLWLPVQNMNVMASAMMAYMKRPNSICLYLNIFQQYISCEIKKRLK